jgi:hypothetical protein
MGPGVRAGTTIEKAPSGPSLKNESLSISGDGDNGPQRTEFRETQYEWEYGRGADQTGLAMKIALSPLVIPGSLASLAPRNDDSSFCHHQPE